MNLKNPRQNICTRLPVSLSNSLLRMYTETIMGKYVFVGLALSSFWKLKSPFETRLKWGVCKCQRCPKRTHQKFKTAAQLKCRAETKTPLTTMKRGSCCCCWNRRPQMVPSAVNQVLLELKLGGFSASTRKSPQNHRLVARTTNSTIVLLSWAALMVNMSKNNWQLTKNSHH